MSDTLHTAKRLMASYRASTVVMGQTPPAGLADLVGAELPVGPRPEPLALLTPAGRIVRSVSRSFGTPLMFATASGRRRPGRPDDGSPCPTLWPRPPFQGMGQ